MPKIDDYIVQRVIDAAKIEDVVGDFVTLRRSGANLTGLCPFHDDYHDGNFIVRPSTVGRASGGNTFHCFACMSPGDGGGPVEFLMRSQRMTFPEAIRYLGKKYHIDVDNVPVSWTPPPPKPTPPPPPLLELKRELVRQTMDERTYARNFITWLWNLPWNSQQRDRFNDVLWQYCVGGWSDGRVVFWQIDADGVPRAAKLMRYNEDGHRNKKEHPGWIYNQKGLREEYDPDNHKILKPLFGGHLVRKYPQAEVHIVESEKTAIFCAIYFGDMEKHLWLATAGKGNLKIELLQPLIDQQRIIALHPDKDGIDDWDKRRKDIGYERAYINNTILTFQWKPEDGDKADVADVLERVMEEEQRDKTVKKLADIIPSVEPAARLLVEKNNLIEEPDNG